MKVSKVLLYRNPRLNNCEVRFLSVLQTFPGGYQMTNKELAKMLATSVSTLTRTMRSLRENSLIVSDRDDNKMRVIKFHKDINKSLASLP